MKQSIKQLALTVMKKYKTDNPFEICRCMKIPVVFSPLGSLNGLCTINYNISIIYINSDLDDFHQKLACAHELGHIFLRHKINKFLLSQNTYLKEKNYEIEADRFAIEFLISDSIINDNKLYSFDQLSYIYNIPADLAKYKIKNISPQLSFDFPN